MIYKCKHCGELLGFDKEDFDCGGTYHPDGEELLWGHLQLDHPDIFERDVDLETPYMIEENYILMEE